MAVGFWGKWDKKDVIFKNKAGKLFIIKDMNEKQTQTNPKTKPGSC
jgi:hypothetical protein